MTTVVKVSAAPAAWKATSPTPWPRPPKSSLCQKGSSSLLGSWTSTSRHGPLLLRYPLNNRKGEEHMHGQQLKGETRSPYQGLPLSPFSFILFIGSFLIREEMESQGDAVFLLIENFCLFGFLLWKAPESQLSQRICQGYGAANPSSSTAIYHTKFTRRVNSSRVRRFLSQTEEDLCLASVPSEATYPVDLGGNTVGLSSPPPVSLPRVSCRGSGSSSSPGLRCGGNEGCSRGWQGWRRRAGDRSDGTRV